MKVHYPKLYNMSHFFSLNIVTASKGSNNNILLYNVPDWSTSRGIVLFGQTTHFIDLLVRLYLKHVLDVMPS